MPNIYELMANQGLRRRQEETATDTMMQGDMLRERVREAEAMKEKADKTELGGFIGKLIAGIGAAVATGGMSLPASAAITGASSGLGSYAGREIGSSSTGKLNPGLFNVEEDRQMIKEFEESKLAHSLSDAVKSGLLAYSLGDTGILDKALGKGGWWTKVKTPEFLESPGLYEKLSDSYTDEALGSLDLTNLW